AQERYATKDRKGVPRRMARQQGDAAKRNYARRLRRAMPRRPGRGANLHELRRTVDQRNRDAAAEAFASRCASCEAARAREARPQPRAAEGREPSKQDRGREFERRLLTSRPRVPQSGTWPTQVRSLHARRDAAFD